MGMGNPMGCLNGVVRTLQKTWQAWFEEPDKKRRKKLEKNFEYLLREAHTFLGYVDEEWRSAFKKPKMIPKYDQHLQFNHVDKFVPSWERTIKPKKATNLR